MTSLLTELQTLEVELHHPGVRCNRERLETLLHPEFCEVGRSGREYTRETVINHLLVAQSAAPVVSESFTLCQLARGAALLTYRSAHGHAGKILTNHTLRSSVWLQTAVGWQLRYHQGTPAANTW
jgi:hypothetical protein